MQRQARQNNTDEDEVTNRWKHSKELLKENAEGKASKNEAKVTDTKLHSCGLKTFLWKKHKM
jgi:hypothetical protein